MSKKTIRPKIKLPQIKPNLLWERAFARDWWLQGGNRERKLAPTEAHLSRAGLKILLLGLLLALLTLGACGDEAANKLAVTKPGNATTVATQPAATVAAVSEADKAEAAKINWFQMRPEQAQNWQLLADPADKMKFTLTLKDKSQKEGNEKKLLTLFPKKSSAYDIALNTLLSDYQSNKLPVSFTAINYNNEAEAGQRALDFAQSEKFDLIFTLGSEATAFVHAKFRNGPIPVVTVVSKDPVLLGQMPNYEAGSGTNIAYTSVNVPIELQMLYLQELKPNLKNIAVMYEKSNSSAIETQVEPLRKAAQARNINVLDVIVVNDKEARAELAAKVPEALKKMAKNDPDQTNSIFWVTGSTSVINEIAIINQNAAKIPVMSVFPELVQEGDNSAVLSIGVSFETNTHLAAVYGLYILQGRNKAGDLKVGTITPPDIAINFRKANQVGLKIPFALFESASYVYDYDGKAVRKAGQSVNK